MPDRLTVVDGILEHNEEVVRGRGQLSNGVLIVPSRLCFNHLKPAIEASRGSNNLQSILFGRYRGYPVAVPLQKECDWAAKIWRDIFVVKLRCNL